FTPRICPRSARPSEPRVRREVPQRAPRQLQPPAHRTRKHDGRRPRTAAAPPPRPFLRLARVDRLGRDAGVCALGRALRRVPGRLGGHGRRALLLRRAGGTPRPRAPGLRTPPDPDRRPPHPLLALGLAAAGLLARQRIGRRAAGRQPRAGRRAHLLPARVARAAPGNQQLGRRRVRVPLGRRVRGRVDRRGAAVAAAQVRRARAEGRRAPREARGGKGEERARAGGEEEAQRLEGAFGGRGARRARRRGLCALDLSLHLRVRWAARSPPTPPPPGCDALHADTFPPAITSFPILHPSPTPSPQTDTRCDH
ncbi:hypothetical protein DFJ74DRAFT_457899, partial [Hyaloraphidium curvatum]